MKRKIAFFMATAMLSSVVSACSTGSFEDIKPPSDLQEPLAGYQSMRPKKITLMSDTSMTWEDGLQKVCNEYEARTGIVLEVERPDHQKYYERVAETFAAGTPCDVIEMSGYNYPIYAMSDKLWDMSHAWEVSSLNATGYVEKEYIDANMIDGKLYGFPLAKGKGSITYVRNDMLKKAGLAVPKNYNEFISMLRAFKEQGVIPFTASGIINSDTPYNIYLPEFYQDANPDFIKKGDKYVDGMTEPEMKAALERMRNAYAEGLFDSEIITNKSSAVRDKMYDGRAASTNYWTGYGVKFDKAIKKINPEAEIVPIKAIEETNYIKRQSINFVINNVNTGSEERRNGIFDYLIAYSHDGGEGQLLFTKGVENIHWVRNEDGKLETLETAKAFYDDNASFVSTYDEYENMGRDEKSLRDIEILDAKSIIAPLGKVTANTVDSVEEITNARTKAINDIVTGKVSIEDGLADYTNAVGDKIDAVLAEFNK